MAIGETLRQVREGRRLSLDDAVAVTKIRRKYLEALENEQFDILPGPTYARCFLGTYARFLGLNTKELVQELDRTFLHGEETVRDKPVEAGEPAPPFLHTAVIRKIEAPARLTEERDNQLMLQIRGILAGKRRPSW